MISDINQQIRHYKLTPAYFEYDETTEKASIISTRTNSIGMNDTLRDFLGFKENDSFEFSRTIAEKNIRLECWFTSDVHLQRHRLIFSCW